MSIPPLHGFLVFETVARLGNLSAAAAQLHVTVGAVSLQIRSLQTALGAELFQKQGRRLVLTECGLVLQQAVARGIGEISEGVRLVAEYDKKALAPITLTLSIDPVFGSAWLLSKLFEFQAQHTHVHLRVLSASRFDEVDWRKTDLAFLYDTPPWAGFWWRRLHSLNTFPVCSPRLARGIKAIRQPSDLIHHRLLHEDDGTQWRSWLLEANLAYPGQADVHLEDFGLALQAARDGYGVALSDEISSARDLDE
ncbi:LysR family transcriptional regulator, partial [Pseudomonas sp. MWU12-2312b]